LERTNTPQSQSGCFGEEIVVIHAGLCSTLGREHMHEMHPAGAKARSAGALVVAWRQMPVVTWQIVS